MGFGMSKRMSIRMSMRGVSMRGGAPPPAFFCVGSGIVLILKCKYRYEYKYKYKYNYQPFLPVRLRLRSGGARTCTRSRQVGR